MKRNEREMYWLRNHQPDMPNTQRNQWYAVPCYITRRLYTQIHMLQRIWYTDSLFIYTLVCVFGRRVFRAKNLALRLRLSPSVYNISDICSTCYTRFTLIYVMYALYPYTLLTIYVLYTWNSTCVQQQQQQPPPPSSAVLISQWYSGDRAYWRHSHAYTC